MIRECANETDGPWNINREQQQQQPKAATNSRGKFVEKCSKREKDSYEYWYWYSDSFIQLACHNSFLLYKQAECRPDYDGPKQQQQKLFIDKFRRKRKSSEHRADRKENNKRENILFFWPQKAQNTKAKKKQKLKEKRVEKV